MFFSIVNILFTVIFILIISSDDMWVYFIWPLLLYFLSIWLLRKTYSQKSKRITKILISGGYTLILSPVIGLILYNQEKIIDKITASEPGFSLFWHLCYICMLLAHGFTISLFFSFLYKPLLDNASLHFHEKNYFRSCILYSIFPIVWIFGTIWEKLIGSVELNIE